LIRYFIKRILLLIPVIVIVSFIVFTLMDLVPGDPLASWDLGSMSVEEVEALRESLGLNDPLLVRYGRYMFKLVQGELGVSDLTGISVMDVFMSRLPNSLLLVFAGFGLGVLIAIPLGVIAARRAGKITDTITTAFTMIGMSMPSFWLGVLMILLFSYYLGWLPVGGNRDGLPSIVMPAICFAMGLIASTTR